MKAKTAKTKTVTIKVDEKNPEPVEIIAKAIIDVSEAFQRMQAGKLKQRAIVLLIKDMCPNIRLGDIEEILNTVPKLKDRYLK